jgi:hypothetical protein
MLRRRSSRSARRQKKRRPRVRLPPFDLTHSLCHLVRHGLFVCALI